MENYTSDSSDSDHQSKVIDFSKLSESEHGLNYCLETVMDANKFRISDIEVMFLNNNSFKFVPENVFKFLSLRVLDISYTGVSELPSVVLKLPLFKLIAKNNALCNESLPKLLPNTIKELNFSGNNFQYFPEQILEMKSLKYLYLGGNQIASIPKDIRKLTK